MPDKEAVLAIIELDGLRRVTWSPTFRLHRLTVAMERSDRATNPATMADSKERE